MLPTLLVPGSIKGVTDVPVDYIISWIKSHMYEYGNMNATLNDRILIIRAETGSGKSTVMPVNIFRILRNKDTPSSVSYRGQKVLCTQPRVLTAIELSRTVSVNRSSWNPDMIVGKTVGYVTKPRKEKSYGLIYATTGVLRAKLNTNTDEEIMDEYKFIIIDEAHERSIDSDVLLFMLYKFYKRNEGNKKLPFLLFTSATFEPKKYADYYDVSYDNIIKVVGSTFSIETHWGCDTSNVYDSIVKTVMEINKNKDDPEKGDILIFAPGVKEIKDIEKRIKRDIKDYLLILKLDGESVRKETSEYLLIFEPYKKLPKINGSLPTRRIIISTSVAETGITINTLRYVIDMGFHRGSESYPIINVSGLVTRPATQSRITQRKGRCGRLFEGDFYPMYSKETYESLDKQQYPDIITSYKEYNMVHLLFYRLLDDKMDINKLRLLDKPSIESFIGANSIATILGFVNNDCKLTELGKLVSKFSSITMESAKIIFSGFGFNVFITDLITIASIMQVSNGMLFMKDYMYKKFMESVNLNINTELPCNAHIMESILPRYIVSIVGGGSGSKDPDSYYYRYKTIICDDFIESLLSFESFNKQIMSMKNNKNISEWCQKKCINVGMLSTIYEVRERIIEDLLSNGIDILYNSEHRLIDQSIDNFMPTIINIKRCLYEGLKHNLLTYDCEHKTYKTLQDLHINVENSILSPQLQNKLKSLNVLSEDIQPKYIITDNLNLSVKNDNTILYEVHANYISILDGYVYPDTSFGEPMYSTNTIENIHTDDADELQILEAYDRLNRDINSDITMPMCKLDSDLSKLFGSSIIKKIINPMCHNI